MDIEIATSVRYGNYKEHLKYATSLVQIVKIVQKEIRRYINLPDDIQIIMRPMRGLLGCAFHYKEETGSRFVVELDVRQSISSFCDTLLHEMVHIEQFFEGRLGKTPTESTYYQWEGKNILNDTKNNYENLP